MRTLSLIWVVASKDLQLTWRSKEAFLNTLFFALLILVLFLFAFDPGSQSTRDASPGILWVAFLFPGIIQLNRSFQLETEEGTLSGILLSPLDRGLLFLGKSLANWLFLLGIDLFILLAFVVFFNFSPSWTWLWVLLLMVLVSCGFTAVGTVFSAMVSSIRTRDVLLPILLFPIVVPLLVAAVNATRELLLESGAGYVWSLPWGEANYPLAPQWVNLLLVFDVIYLCVGFVVIDYVLGE